MTLSRIPPQALLLAGLLLAATPLWAGSEGRIEGTVRDPLGKVVTEAWVAVRPLERDVQFDARTDRKGEFELLLDDATGTWFIQIQKEGYRTLREPLEPVVGGTLSRGWILTAGSDEEAEEEAAAVEAANRAAALYNQGAEAFNAGDLDGAREGFLAALEIDPDLAAAHAALMRLYLAQKSYPEAAAAAGRLLALEPRNVMALRVRHDALRETGDKAAAADLLELLIELDPTPGTARRVFNTGVDAYQAQEFDDAAERFERALAIDSELDAARQALAGLLLALGRVDEAVPHADRLAAAEEPGADAQTVLFAIYRAAGDEEKARRAFDSLRQLDAAGLTSRLLEEGETAFKADRVEEAAANFRLVLEIDPEHPHPRATYFLGLCALNQGDTEEGRRLLERFLSLAPDDPEAPAAKEILDGI